MKAAAEALKAKGNALMSQKLYDSAIEQYTDAIKLDSNPVYYSNRAAAWGGLGEHGKAVEDAEKAIELDPKFSKAYSRLGYVESYARNSRLDVLTSSHAHFSNGDYQSAVDAYEAGLKLDPSNPNMKAALSTAKSRVSESSSVADREPSAGGGGPDLASMMRGMGGGGAGGGGGGAGGMPDLAGLASMMGGLGGGGGGMPDLASLMQNPQMMQMYVSLSLLPSSFLLVVPYPSNAFPAIPLSSSLQYNPMLLEYLGTKLTPRAQQMMQNGGLDRMMQNPNIRQMAEQMQNGGGMPDFSQLAQDPAMRDM